jgi:hypothetical protein
VIADGCEDHTAAVARSFGVNVLTLNPSRGKAGGIEAALERFQICRRFQVLFIVDADTQVDEQYLDRGLRLLGDDRYTAVAGYAYASWRPEELSAVGRFLVSYRSRVYSVAQWMRYGQTWRHTNVSYIVPGFASMYRTDVLPRIDLNPPGLIIEDFNMTFELRHKQLGKVAFEPMVFGITQDPDTLPEYYRQVTRWQLGFWQTLRRHGLWLSWFSGSLGVFVVEVLLGSLILLVSMAGAADVGRRPALPRPGPALAVVPTGVPAARSGALTHQPAGLPVPSGLPADLRGRGVAAPPKHPRVRVGLPVRPPGRCDHRLAHPAHGLADQVDRTLDQPDQAAGP